MMVKLTLSVPEKVLIRAKVYSRKTRQPLSRLVSRYFALLSRKTEDGVHPITPKVRQVTGLVKSNKADEDLLLEALGSKYK